MKAEKGQQKNLWILQMIGIEINVKILANSMNDLKKMASAALSKLIYSKMKRAMQNLIGKSKID